MEPGNVVYVHLVDPVDDKLSKAEILRGLITEKLTTAAQEILAVVERTVAGYEEEVSGLRQEVERQRKQIEVVLQPQVTLCRIDEHGLISVRAGAGELTQEEEKQQTHVEEAAGSQDVLALTEEKEVSCVDTLQHTRIDQEDLRDPDHLIPNTGVQPVKTTLRISDPLNLRVCLLKESKSNRIKKGMLKSPIRRVTCPLGMKEADFVDRLRFTFPQLKGPFDAFTTDATRKLTPLKVKTLTPEEVYKSIKSTGKGRSALYIRVKTRENERKHKAATDSTSTSTTTTDKCGCIDPVETVETDGMSGNSRTQQTETEDGADGDDSPALPALTCGSPAPSPVHSEAESDCTEDGQTDDSDENLMEIETNTKPSIRRTFLPFSDRSVVDNTGDTSDACRNQEEGDGVSKSEDGEESISSNTETQKPLLKSLRVCLLKINVLGKGEEEAGSGELTEEQEQQRRHIYVEDASKSQDVSDPAGNNNDVGSAEGPAQSTSLDQRDLRGPDHPITNRRAQATKNKFRISDPLNLRVCLLKESKSNKLKGCMLKSPMRTLKCPLGMKEADFLDRLRSTFPQLTGPFEAFTTNTSRKLTPLKVKTLTPEEVYKSIKSTGKGRSALYILVKKERKHEAATDSPFTSETSRKHRSDHSTADGEENHSDNDSTEDRQTDHEDGELHFPKMRKILLLRVCLLKDIQTNMLTKGVSPIRKLKCPRGMKEAEFLERLRSTFPQLTGPVDAFTTDASRKLTPLKVKTLTPEEIYKSIKSTGKGRSALYIRIKPADQQQTAEKELHLQKRKHEASTDSPSTSSSTNDETRKQRSVCSESRQTESVCSNSRTHQMETEHGDDRDHGLTGLPDPNSCSLAPPPTDSAADSEKDCSSNGQRGSDQGLIESKTDPLSSNTKRKRSIRRSFVPVCARSEEDTSENDMSDGVSDDEWEPHDDDESPLRHRVCFFNETKKSSRPTQGNDETTTGSLSTSTRRKDENVPHGSSHNRPVEKEKSSAVDLQASNSRQQQHMETEPEDVRAPPSARSETENECSTGEDEVKESEKDVEWKPDENDGEQGESEPDSSSRKKQVKKLGVKTKTRKRLKLSPKTATKGIVSCRVCGSLHNSMNILIRHAWIHVDNPEGVCGVCGEEKESAEELRSHLQSHLKTHNCNICGKSYISIRGLTEHVASHKGIKPYKCKICHKAFSKQSILSTHEWVHTEDKPHKCNLCPQSFILKHQLDIHTMSHTGEKPYRCNVCNKSFSHLRALSLHKAIHTGQKNYPCQICGMRFIRHAKLKVHEKIHTVRDKPYLCDVCCKTFYLHGELKAHLKTHSNEKVLCYVCGNGLSSVEALNRHMEIHKDERKYRCSECGRGFNSRSTLRGHMRTHTGEKRFVCGICGKACSRLEHLKVHMRTHNGERPYKCTVCDKAFTQTHCLKTHMKSHQREETSAVEGLKNSSFSSTED
ncbi:uncharacterized protein LOC113168214 [Anabas testudineus]|uniref:uncharacterized protein LOC113168214 n=1 Tax=Anabas testudineus TaxID=64144 RepID=UPI000E46548E|nr:uncharacterized protein LOC113168214 [Anabas testudineus]